MELRALAERILLHPDLEVKLTCPDKVTDENPGKPAFRDLSPERNQVLQFKDHQGDTSFPAHIPWKRMKLEGGCFIFLPIMNFWQPN